MSGMLAIINASEADYQSLTQSIYNSAGAAERMANIKLDNLAGDLTLLQSATDGLSLSIGEQFMPQARGLVQISTSIITFVNQLIDDHPVLTKVIMGTAGAVGVVTAGVVAFNAAKKAAAAIELASLFATAGPILAGAAAIGAITAGVIAWADAANEGKPKIDELTEAARGLDQAMADAAVGYENSQTELMATANMADHYLSRLEALDGITNRTSQQQAEYHATLSMLAETVPELAGSIDLTTDSIEGGTEALRAQTEAWKENAKAQAYQDYLKTVYAEQAAAELEHEKAVVLLTNAQADLRDMEAERSDILREMHAMENDPSLYDGEKYRQLESRILALNAEYMDAEDSLSVFQKAVYESDAILSEAEGKTKDYEDALASLTGQTEKSASAMSGFSRTADSITGANMTSTIGGMVTAGLELMGTLGRVSDEYYSTYNAAYESISGQMGLFGTMSVSVETSAQDMIAALQSQADYMAQYSANIQAAAEMGLSQGLIAQLSDGSQESAAYLQAIVDGGAEAVQELNDTFAEVEQGKEAFSTTIAQLQADVDRTMQDASQSVKTAVDEMDLHAQALESSRSTFQGLIDGAESMLEPVRIAYGNVALGALSAIQSSMGVGLAVTRGYATGTENAEPGFAMVGENGPELVFFQGGEQVVNAAQTAAMQRQPAISAMPAGGYGGEPITVQIYFQFEGNATPEAVDRLREYGAEFEARVRQVMEDVVLENARVSMR